MVIDSDTILSIFAILLLIAVSIMLGCQYMNGKNKPKKKMKWTCGVEGGCEQTMHGTYSSKQECEQKCGDGGEETENYKGLKEQMEELKKDKEDLKKSLDKQIKNLEHDLAINKTYLS